MNYNRPIAGRLTYNTPPEPGTIIGPIWTNEMLVVLGQDEDGKTVVGYAQKPELEEAARRQMEDGLEPRSIAEVPRRANGNRVEPRTLFGK